MALLCAPMYAQVHNAGKMTVASFLSHTIQARYVCMTGEHARQLCVRCNVCRITHQDDVSNYDGRNHKCGGHDLRRELHPEVVISHVLAPFVIHGLE